MAAVLADPDWQPTRAEVAELIERAFRSGAETAAEDAYAAGRRDEAARQTELNIAALSAGYATPPYDGRALAESLARKHRRERWDAWAVRPHRGDYPGGPVAPW